MIDGDVPRWMEARETRDSILTSKSPTTRPSGWLRQFNEMANAYWSKGSSEQTMPTLTQEISRSTNLSQLYN